MNYSNGYRTRPEDVVYMCERCGKQVERLCVDCESAAQTATAQYVSDLLERLQAVLARLLEKAEKGGAK